MVADGGDCKENDILEMETETELGVRVSERPLK